MSAFPYFEFALGNHGLCKFLNLHKIEGLCLDFIFVQQSDNLDGDISYTFLIVPR